MGTRTETRTDGDEDRWRRGRMGTPMEMGMRTEIGKNGGMRIKMLVGMKMGMKRNRDGWG